MGKKTDELMKILRNNPDADTFLKQNRDELLQRTLPELLQSLLEEKGLLRADVIRKANLDRNYAYQIFDGRHKPSRDKLICLIFGMGLTVPEAQIVLKTAQFQPLYPRVERDVLILESLFQKKTLLNCNFSLESHGLEPLH